MHLSYPYNFLSFLFIKFWKEIEIKVGLSTSKKVSIIYFNGKPFKNDQNAFYSILKALSEDI